MGVQASQSSWSLVIPLVLPLAMGKKTKKSAFIVHGKNRMMEKNTSKNVVFLLFFFFSWFRFLFLIRLHPTATTNAAIPLTMLIEHFIGIIILLVISGPQ
jgi:serine acetyltransferase